MGQEETLEHTNQYMQWELVTSNTVFKWNKSTADI